MVPNIYRNQIGLVLRQNYKNKMFFNFPQVSFKKQNFQKFEINELILRLFIVITDCGKNVLSISMALSIKFLLSVGYQHSVDGQGVGGAVTCHNAPLMSIHCKIVRAAAIFLRKCFLKMKKIQNQQFDHKKLNIIVPR